MHHRHCASALKRATPSPERVQKESLSASSFNIEVRAYRRNGLRRGRLGRVQLKRRIEFPTTETARGKARRRSLCQWLLVVRATAALGGGEAWG